MHLITGSRSTVFFVLALLLGLQSVVQARDYITVVGSSTIFPYSVWVAERFGRSTLFKTPRIEATGSGGGLKLFCAGVGVDRPDITNAARRITGSEFDVCQANGVKDIVEVKIGYDGIVIANSKHAEQYDLTPKDIFLALAENVPDPKGGKKLVANPYRTWKEVNITLPDVKIEVLGPPPTTGTRDTFAELAMEAGCKEFGFINDMKKTDKRKYKAVCHGVREDGAYIEASENVNLIVQKLQVNPRALGIFGFSFLDLNTDKIKGAKVNGVIPTLDSIASGNYPVSRSLYFYVKKAHVGTIPGIEEYLAEFTSEAASGKEGYLANLGLIPLSPSEHAKQRHQASKLVPLTKSALRTADTAPSYKPVEQARQEVEPPQKGITQVPGL
jgi:phosphate transport system substrate-binding protein